MKGKLNIILSNICYTVKQFELWNNPYYLIMRMEMDSICDDSLSNIVYSMNAFIVWLVLVVAWNFGYPAASPIEDVIVAVILSFFSMILKKKFKM